MASPGLPLFRSRRLLRVLNVLGVGATLASLTGVVFGRLFASKRGLSWDDAAMAAAVPTLVLGTLWAAMVRRQADGWHWWHRNWVISVPLAILNSSLVAMVLFASSNGLRDALVLFLPSLLLSASVGMVYWVPALAMAQLLFGAPIAWAQRQARRGLAGEESGERFVGSTLCVLATMSLAGVLWRPHLTLTLHGVWVWPQTTASRLPDSMASWLLVSLALLGLTTGATAAVLAWQRERRRRRFVADAEAGRAPGYRVEPTADGKVLVRLARPLSGEHGYRAVLDEDEELFALDERGLATHERQAGTARE